MYFVCTTCATFAFCSFFNFIIVYLFHFNFYFYFEYWLLTFFCFRCPNGKTSLRTHKLHCCRCCLPSALFRTGVLDKQNPKKGRPKLKCKKEKNEKNSNQLQKQRRSLCWAWSVFWRWCLLGSVEKRAKNRSTKPKCVKCVIK